MIFTGDSKEILKRFRETGAKVLFSSEGFCWPDKSLEVNNCSVYFQCFINNLFYFYLERISSS